MKDKELKRASGFYVAQVEHPPFRGISSEVVYYDEHTDTVSVFDRNMIVRRWGNPVKINPNTGEAEPL